MNAPTSIEQTLAAWLDRVGPQDVPGRVVDEALASVAVTPQVRPWPRLEGLLPRRGLRVPSRRLAWIVAALVAAIAVSAALLVGARLLLVTPIPRGDLLAVSMDGDIWTMRPDGSELLNLTSTPDVDELAPFWSPDGSRLAFWGRVTGVGVDEPRFGLWLLEGDGQRRALLPVQAMSRGLAAVRGAFDPWLSWSPDGGYLAWSTGLPPFASVHVMDMATGATAFDDLLGGGAHPAFSPDGMRLAWLSGAPPIPSSEDLGGAACGGDPCGVFIADLRGTPHRMFVDTTGIESGVPESIGWIGRGRAIAFSVAIGPYPGRSAALWRVWPDGSGLQPLAGWVPGTREGHDLVPSKDGTRFAVFDGPGLLVLDSEGQVVDRLRAFNGDGAVATWSPDGTSIAFTPDGRSLAVPPVHDATGSGSARWREATWLFNGDDGHRFDGLAWRPPQPGKGSGGGR